MTFAIYLLCFWVTPGTAYDTSGSSLRYHFWWWGNHRRLNLGWPLARQAPYKLNYYSGS